MPETAVNEAPPSALVTLAKELAKASADVETQEEKLKKFKAVEAVLEKKLVEEMITQDIKSFRTNVGGFRTEACVYPNVIDKEVLNAYVKKNKKLAFLYSVSVHGGKLRSYVKELLQQGKKIPPGIEPFTMTEIRRFK